jgi:predicted O-methyltransferase YrrM
MVLEIGSWQGTSAAAFAAGDPDTTVLTIDHHSDPGDAENQARTVEACNEYPNLNYVQGCSTEMVTAEKTGTRCILPIVQEFLGETKIDILFIDGWHGGQFARADYDSYAPFLSPTALVICDDICGGDSAAIFGMQAFWDGLPGTERHLDGRIHAGYPMGFLKHVGAYKATGYADDVKAPDYEVGN